jgi:hypothetical protein
MLIIEQKIAYCKRCDAEFFKKTANQIFCSHRCKAPLVESYASQVGQPKMVTGECRECAKEFLKRATSLNQFCCTSECYRKYANRTNRENRPRECKHCGKKFTFDGKHVNCCSDNCKEAYYRKKGISCVTIACSCGAEFLIRKDTRSIKENRKWLCHKCLFSDAKIIHCEKCGLKTRSYNGRTKCAPCLKAIEQESAKCDTCNTAIRKKGETRCSYCKERPQQVEAGVIAPQGQRRGPYKKKPVVAPKLPAYPCATCKAGKQNDASETGWECAKSATVCKPWAGAKLHEQR